MTDQPQFFWKPPNGEKILGICPWRDLIVIATTDGVYIMTATGRALDELEVKKIRVV